MMKQFEKASADVSYADLAERLDRIETELARLSELIEIGLGQAKRERRVISHALGMIQDDSNFYNSQFVGAFTRLSEHLHAIAAFLQGGKKGTVKHKDKPIIAEDRMPRPVPQIEED